MVFKNYLGRNKRDNRISLGSPEAEAESNLSSSIPLQEVYEDYDDLMYQLTHEKFIIVGRKGCGKSAFAEYIHGLSIKEPNLFCEFIKKNDSNLEKIVQIGLEENHPIERENLFKWIIYTKLLKLISENEGLTSYKDYAQLRQFIKTNRGYIDIRDSEIKELIKTDGFEVNIVPFKRFFTSKLNKKLEIHQTKAPFYKLLPHLEEVIVKLLTSNQEIRNENSYVIFFDDLDIGFSTKDKNSIESIVSLIRVCKHINNHVFGKTTANVKAVILLRDDIEKYISSINTQADTAKIFSSYSCRINWFQSFYNTRDANEDDLNLKKFINKRIVYAFNKEGIKLNISDPWSSLVLSEKAEQSSFKYIVNHTLYRPRDLLLYFLPLQNGNFSYPLSNSDLYTLTGAYADELAKELTNELSSFYESDEIKSIYNAIGDISQKTNCTYDEAILIIEQNCKLNSSSLLEYLFDRSIIGNVNPSNNWVFFKCREPISTSEPYSLHRKHNIVIHNGFKVYFHNKGYA